MTEPPLVLVTGGTGFLAKWVLAYLLQSPENYRVRTTLRTPSRKDEITSSLLAAGISPERISSLSIVTTDLNSNEGWADALQNVTFVQHIASPFPNAPPKNEDDLLNPAIEGTRRVLRFAKDARVKRVVVTSSSAAVQYGLANRDKRRFTEEDWTDLSGPKERVSLYARSKTLAEKAAWEFMEREGEGKDSGMELSVVNPVMIFGPALGKEDGTSLHAITELMEGTAPGIPRLQFNIVDVRDCARLHLLVMTERQAAGERFLCIGEGSLWMGELARLLKRNLGEKASKVPSLGLPDFAVRLVALVMPIARLILQDLGIEREPVAEKARDVLGWKWEYTTEQAVMASVESLERYGH
ncbi:hypothetical protein BJY04DRAFT_191635 [Aspergillus karnatakaensis]|uniref:uncharacterized protein n=1 Tax=Aspergillus karnatakaensis TaxID=1810916 RepID=UPI003CCCC909